MVFDSKEHKAIVAELIDKASFAGAVAEHVVALKKAVSGAAVQEPWVPEHPEANERAA